MVQWTRDVCFQKTVFHQYIDGLAICTSRGKLPMHQSKIAILSIHQRFSNNPKNTRLAGTHTSERKWLLFKPLSIVKNIKSCSEGVNSFSIRSLEIIGTRLFLKRSELYFGIHKITFNLMACKHRFSQI